MNEIVNKFLLAGDKFMPAMHLKQPALTYCACGPFTKNKERIQKFKIDKLVTECTENIDEVKIEITSMESHSTKLHSTGHENVCVCSYTICVTLAVMALAISIEVVAYFAYSRWYLKKNVACISTHNQWNCPQTT